MAIRIRPATASDQASITAFVRQVRINRRDLDWRRFMVAEDEGRVVGVGQVRVYPAGARELASGVVLPEYRGQGVGWRLVEALLARETGPLYLLSMSRTPRATRGSGSAGWARPSCPRRSGPRIDADASSRRSP